MRSYLLGLTLGAWFAVLCVLTWLGNDSQVGAFMLGIVLLVIPCWLLAWESYVRLTRPLLRRLRSEGER